MGSYDPNNSIDGGFPGLAWANPSYAASQGFPAVLPGESLQSYLNRIYPGTSWHAGGGDPVSAAIETIGGAGLTAVLDVGSLGLSSSLGLDTTIHAGLASDIAMANAPGGSGKTYTSAGLPGGFDPSKGPLLAQHLAQLKAAQARLKAQIKKPPSKPLALVGLVAPAPTPSNPKAGRTIFGVPVVDVGVGGALLAGLGYLVHRSL